MDKTLRNTLIGMTGAAFIAIAGAWVQLNSRISILEVQVNNDHQLFIDSQDDMKEIKSKLDEINVKVTHLNDVKEDRDFMKGK